MKYLCLFSGISAPSVAWKPLGWEPVGFAEIDPFPCAVLSHRYPGVPNFGDITTIQVQSGSADVVVGGSPCQSFSVAGKRLGLDDPRGNLAFKYLQVVRRARPKWIVFENVPGLLSSERGNDFAAFLSVASGWRIDAPRDGWGNSGIIPQRTGEDYGLAYRVLNAEHFGVPQRRRRVFVVGYLGDWRLAAAVLFERDSLSGNPPPSRKTGSVVTSALTRSLGSGGADAARAQANHLTTLNVSPPITSNPYGDHASREGLLVTEANSTRPGAVARPLTASMRRLDADTEELIVAYACQGSNVGKMGTLRQGNGSTTGGVPFVAQATRSVVRRLTPMECEKLQGFPKDWSLVPYQGKLAADGPRYKAIGNSMAVPVVRWIGERIDQLAKVN